MEEIWKDIPGYESYYQVSNMGNVRSVDRYITQEHRCGIISRLMKGRILKQNVSKTGYKVVFLCIKGKPKTLKVHRLVAITFLDNPHSYKVINHIDENKFNNIVGNLEWCDYSYNNSYGQGSDKRKRTMRLHTGKKIGQYTLDGHLVHVFDSIGLAGKYMGCNKTSIFKVCKGENKSCLGYNWKYIND